MFRYVRVPPSVIKCRQCLHGHRDHCGHHFVSASNYVSSVLTLESKGAAGGGPVALPHRLSAQSGWPTKMNASSFKDDYLQTHSYCGQSKEGGWPSGCEGVTKSKTRGPHGIMILQKNRNFMTCDDVLAKKLHQSGVFFTLQFWTWPCSFTSPNTECMVYLHTFTIKFKQI